MSIKIKGLNYIYAAGTPFEKAALKDINLEIADGEFAGIIGHTGSGKSTLIQHINGLIRPTSGEIEVDGRKISRQSNNLNTLCREVGLVFQYPEHQLFELTVAKDIAFGPKNLGLPPEEVERRVKEAAALVGLKEKYMEKSPFELSGGQKRRVAIAGVLAMRPKILILDEPTAGLDPKGRDSILRQIRGLHRQTGATVLLVSHSMEDVAEYVDRVIAMNDGRIVLDGTPREVFSQRDALLSIGLAVPQITELAYHLRERGFTLPAAVITLEEALPLIEEELRRKEL
ncbi:energy-coupling factor transporter ATPase [Lachnospiraceae bacterium oral taxon 500]|nr:energy-coupling factor transporter ATPase [Lachnospiraceae bacterium oral taxon 500]